MCATVQHPQAGRLRRNGVCHQPSFCFAQHAPNLYNFESFGILAPRRAPRACYRPIVETRNPVISRAQIDSNIGLYYGNLAIYYARTMPARLSQ